MPSLRTPQDIIDHWPTLQAAFAREGVAINLQQGLAVFQDLTAAQPPITTGDAIDINTLQIVGGSPDVRAWPVTTTLTALAFGTDGAAPTFDAQNKWPDVTPPGWQGPLQYTLWVCLHINNNWYGVGCIEFWRGLHSNGGDLTNPGQQMASNWFYYAEPMASHVAVIGEQVGFFVTAGDARRKDVHAVEERSNIVVVPLVAAPHSYTF